MTTESQPSPAAEATTDPLDLRMRIGGEAVEAADSRTFDVVGPADGRVVARVPQGGHEDVDRAVAAARAAFDERKGWPTWAAGKRGRMLSKLADLIKKHSEELAQVRRLAPGEGTGYGRRFVADAETWIGIVPVGYADGFRRDMTGTEVVVDGERARVVGTVSMDALAVRLPGPLRQGTPVTLVGDGITLEQHAAVADTIGYEIACGIRTAPGRGERVVAGG